MSKTKNNAPPVKAAPKTKTGAKGQHSARRNGLETLFSRMANMHPVNFRRAQKILARGRKRNYSGAEG